MQVRNPWRITILSAAGWLRVSDELLQITASTNRGGHLGEAHSVLPYAMACMLCINVTYLMRDCQQKCTFVVVHIKVKGARIVLRIVDRPPKTIDTGA